MASPDGIPDARQKICYWVGQTHSFSFIPRSLTTARTCGNACSSFQTLAFSLFCFRRSQQLRAQGLKDKS
jgi:hypothetical protein